MAKKNSTVMVFAIVVIVLLLGFLLFTANSKAARAGAERFYNGAPLNPSGLPPPSVADVAMSAANAPALVAGAEAGVGSFAPSMGRYNEGPQPVAGTDGGVFGGVPVSQAGFDGNSGACFPRDRLSADDLLPKDASSSKWAQVNPAGQGELMNLNLLSAGALVGTDTTQGGMRNASFDIRSAPPNPTQPVSPWMQSTIVPLMNRPLEIGGQM